MCLYPTTCLNTRSIWLVFVSLRVVPWLERWENWKMRIDAYRICIDIIYAWGSGTAEAYLPASKSWWRQVLNKFKLSNHFLSTHQCLSGCRLILECRLCFAENPAQYNCESVKRILWNSFLDAIVCWDRCCEDLYIPHLSYFFRGRWEIRTSASELRSEMIGKINSQIVLQHSPCHFAIYNITCLQIYRACTSCDTIQHLLTISLASRPRLIRS